MSLKSFIYRFILGRFEDMPKWTTSTNCSIVHIFNDKGNYVAHYDLTNNVAILSHIDADKSLINGEHKECNNLYQAMRWAYLKTQRPNERQSK